MRCFVERPVFRGQQRNLSLFEHVRQKSLCHAGFEILVKSSENAAWGLARHAKRACTDYPSPGVWVSVRIWSSRTVAADAPGIETRWVISVFIPIWYGKGLLIWRL